MKIDVIKHFNSIRSAWEISRPLEEGKTDIEKVKKLDLPVNEFSMLHLRIESTIIEREIFSTLRNHHMWAQTSRVQDVLKFTIPQEFSDVDYEPFRENMKKDAIIKRQDDYRLSLPLVSNTVYSIAISARDLIKCFSYFSYLWETLNNYRFAKMFYNSAREIKSVLKGIGYGKGAISQYKLKKILNESIIKKNISTQTGQYLIISSEMGFYMRSQLVRHRDILFKDDIFQSVLNHNHGHLFDLRAPINISIAGGEDAMKEITSKRSCWIAQYNIWAPLLNKINIQVGTNVLPCEDGSCPYKQDNELRYEGKDPNPPCPIGLRLLDKSATSNQIHKMKLMVSDDNRMDFWFDEIEKLNLENKT